MTPDRLVLVPEVTYSELADSIGELGWDFRSGSALPPLVAGEPEYASWRRGTANLVYTCLRSREAESALLGVLAADAVGGQQHLTAVRALLHHPERVVAVAATRATVRLAADRG